jgi:ArsR family transcriptional regulator
MLKTPVGDTRLRILAWLRAPDRGERGATADAVAARFELPRPVVVTHLRLLTSLGMLRTASFAGRLHYRRDEVRIAQVARMLEKGW